MFPTPDLFEDPGGLDLLFEALQGLFKRLTVFNYDFRHASFTPLPKD